MKNISIFILLVILLSSTVLGGFFRPDTPPPNVVNVNAFCLITGCNFTGDIYMDGNTIWNAIIWNATVYNATIIDVTQINGSVDIDGNVTADNFIGTINASNIVGEYWVNETLEYGNQTFETDDEDIELRLLSVINKHSYLYFMENSLFGFRLWYDGSGTNQFKFDAIDNGVIKPQIWFDRNTGDIQFFTSLDLSGYNMTADYFHGSGAYLTELNVTGNVSVGGDLDMSGYSLTTSYLLGIDGGIDMRGDPWYLSQTDLEIDQDLKVNNTEIENDLLVGNNITVVGNVSADYYFGNGSQLTGISHPWVRETFINNRVILADAGDDVGIGIEFPSATLDIGGTLEVHVSVFYVDGPGGKVGIGTNTPQTRLHASVDSSGVFPAFANTDFLFSDTSTSSDESVIAIVGGNGTGGSLIRFGDQDDIDPGVIDYDHGTDTFIFTAGTILNVMNISSGGVNIADLNVTGNVTADYYIGNGSQLTGLAPFPEARHHAEMYWNSTNSTQLTIEINAVDTDVNITGLLEGEHVGMTTDNDGVVTINKSDYYLMLLSMSFESSPSSEFEVNIAINGQDDKHCEGHMETSAVENLGINCIEYLNAGDQITVDIRDESNPPRDVDIHSYNFVILEI